MDKVLVVEQRSVAFPADAARGAIFAGTCSATGRHAVEAKVFGLKGGDALLHRHFLQLAAVVA